MSQPISTFTIRAVKEALKYISPKQTVLLRGRHGIGKSAIAYQAAEEWGLKKVIERRISQLSEGDMIGLPDRGAIHEHDGKQWQVTKFLPTDWFLQAEFEPCLVFLDEINRGTPETMQACFQFIEKGELNGRRIHPESRIIAAINFSKEYQVTPMDPAFTDRFWVADVEPDKEDWLAWARGPGKISEDTIDFIIQCNEDHFEVKPEKMAALGTHEITPSRRSWERFDRHVNAEIAGVKLIETPNNPVLYDIGRGFVGPDAARAFMKFLADRDQNITPQDVLDNYDKIASKIKRLKAEQQTSLIDKIKHYLVSQQISLTEQQGAALGRLIKDLTPECAVTLWSAVSNTNVYNAKMFHPFSGTYIVEIISKTQQGRSLSENKAK